MNLAQFPRRRYTQGATPIEYLPRLTKVLAGPNIFMKRDDMLGLAAGGNKTRKLEFLMADALARNADSVVTCGAIQSNHCRLTLAAAIKEGLACHLVLEERVPNTYNREASGNNFLFHLLGAASLTVVPLGTNLDQAMQEVANLLSNKGNRPYIIPGGGSNPIGATGYVACAQEIVAQSFDMGLSFDAIICASGSGGTHAGLVVGLDGSQSNIPVIGINVRNRKEIQEQLVFDLVKRLVDHLNISDIPRDAVVSIDDYVGPGYSLPTPEMVEAVNLVAKTEGVLLDPVYTGKAMAGLIGLVRREYFKHDASVLFIHTGGSPALYAYTPLFLERSPETE